MRSIIQYEVMYYFKTKVELIVTTVLFASFVVLAPFTLKDASLLLININNSLLWLGSFAVCCLAAHGLYARDIGCGRMEYLQLSPVPLEQVIFAKWVANYLCTAMPVLLILPLAMVFAGQGLQDLARELLGIAIGLAALSLLTNTGAVLMAGLGQGSGAVLGLLILPLSIPVMIFGSAYTQSGDPAYLMFVAGLALFLMPVLCLAGASSIRHSH